MATVDGVVGAISATSNSVVTPCETVSRNCWMLLLYNEDNDYLMMLSLVDLK